VFITLEGPEGSGKTTQIRLLAETLGNLGFDALITREPGGTRIGNAVREVLLNVEHTEMSPRAEALLFNAARAQIVDQVIRPALAKGQIVICDRFYDSTLAYQGYGHGQNLAELRALIEYATGGLKPDVTFYLDIDVNAGLSRKRAGDEWNRLDAQQISFHKAVRSGYLQMIKDEPKRWRLVDASRPIEEVNEELFWGIRERMSHHRQEAQP
jgi:dTMP kinase